MKIRLYPYKTQELLINKSFGCDRFIYNEFLNAKIIQYKLYGKSTNYNQDSAYLTEIKKDKDFAFLNEVSSGALQSSLRKLNTAFQNFFKNGKGFPKFKKKGVHESFTLTDPTTIIDENHIKLPKIGIVKCSGFGKKGTEYNVKNITVTKRAGKYYLSFCYDVASKPRQSKKKLNIVGIDLNLENFLTDSNNKRVENPRIKKHYLKKIKHYQRKISKSQKGSQNRKKWILKLQKTYQKIDNLKQEFLHKTANNYIQNHDVIVVEKLMIKNMVKNHKLAEAISMVSWGEFKRLLKYKAELAGKLYIEVDPHNTSKECHVCGTKNISLTLKDRQWSCSCGAVHVRDHNSAINIKNKGKGIALKTWGDLDIVPICEPSNRIEVREI